MSKRKDHKGRLLQAGEYQRKNGTYEYRWTTGYGERKSIYAKSLSELREMEERMIRESQKFNCPDRMTFADLYETWKRVKRGIKPETMSLYIYTYEHYVPNGPVPEFHTMRLADIRKSTVRHLYTTIMEEMNLKISTILNINTVVQQVFAMAVDDDLIPKNPATGAIKELRAEARIRQSMAEPERDRAMTKAEQETFFNFIRTTRYAEYYSVYRFMLLTGLRTGEVLALQWADIDMEHAELTLRHNMTYIKFPGETKNRIHITSPKNKKWRTIPLCDEAIMLLRERFKTDAANGRHCKMPYDGLQNFVFVNKYNAPMVPNELARTLIQIRKQYNRTHEEEMPRISCHWFRHTFATRMFEAGVQAKTVQEILGHADCRMTLNIYTAVCNDNKRDGIDKMVQYLSSFES